MVSFASAFGIYVHFPYCLSKCPYCDFASVVAERIPHARYAAAVKRELARRAAEFGVPAGGAGSLYFGGGTPSLWDPPQVAGVIEEAAKLFGLAPGCEITLEANPGAADVKHFRALRAAGVNRVSIGVQSFDERVLAGLGRRHSAREAEAAFQRAREAGFENVSLDLIFGGPAHTVEQAERDARRALALRPEHVSCYGLTLEGLAEDVRLAKDVRRGKVRVADDGTQAEMGLRVRDLLQEAGMARYEISNFALPGFESRHNSLYWMGRPYAAAGCGAHGFRRTPAGGYRYGNPRKPEAWLAAVEGGGEIEVERDAIAPAELFEERLFLGLRLAEGLDLEVAARETIGPVPPGVDAAIARLEAQGLVQRRGSNLRCTERGLDFHTEVSVQLIRQAGP
jgi:putative oxygen-independent coproporphyrinogen III oxidase